MESHGALTRLLSMHVLHESGCAKGPENEANMPCRARMPILSTVGWLLKLEIVEHFIVE